MGEGFSGLRIRCRQIALALLLGGCVSFAAATTYEPPRFDELATEAEQIVRGRVVETRSYRAQHAGQPLIETAVTIDVAENERGPVSQRITLILLGGRVGDEVMQVDAMPNLAEGEDVILFVRGNGRNVCPIVGWSHGAFRVKRLAGDGAREFVERWNGEPLVDLAQVPESLERGPSPRASAAAALAPEQVLTAARIERERLRHAR